MQPLEKIAIGITMLASLLIVGLVPDNPLRHLDDPSYWGVIGYYLVFLSILAIRILNKPAAFEQGMLTALLTAMPLIYVANWLRFDGETMWIIAEVAGLIIYGALAITSRHFKLLLSLGIAGHALWDLFHLNQQVYVPLWYIMACAIVDFCAGFYAFTRLKQFQVQVGSC